MLVSLSKKDGNMFQIFESKNIKTCDSQMSAIHAGRWISSMYYHAIEIFIKG
jgi:hypothetical protein